MRRALAIAAVVLFALPAAARAGGGGDESSSQVELKWDLGFGMAVGASQIGTKTFAQAGANLSGQLQLGRVALLANYQMVSTHRSLDDGELLQGRSHRMSLALGFEVHKFGGPLLGGETTVALGTGRQFISWDQGTLSRRDLFIHVEQASVVTFPRGRRGIIRAPNAIMVSIWAQLVASRTPPFAIMPVSATRGDSGETDIGFLAGFSTRFRR